MERRHHFGAIGVAYEQRHADRHADHVVTGTADVESFPSAVGAQRGISDPIAPCDRERLGLGAPGAMRLRWVARQHQTYLDFHRERFARLFP